MAEGGHIGQRIATHRRARRFTQAELARAAYVSLATVRAIERGARSPSDDTLDSIAAALGIDPSRLVTDTARTSDRIRAALPAISAAIAAYDIPDGAPTRPLPQLAAAVAAAEAWRLGAQYSRLAQHAPALLQDALRTVHTATAPADRTAALGLLASTARSAGAVAYKSGAHDLSARLGELMRWAGTQADDPLLGAVAAYVRTETFFAARAHEAGLRALRTAIDAAPPVTNTEHRAALAALHMRAAVVAGRCGDADGADGHLGAARVLTEHVPEGIYQGTAVGPDSVRIHQVSVAVGLGGDHASRAVAIAEEWKPPANLPSERRSGFYIELARAQLWAGRRAEALESLQVARRTAPQHTRQHPWAKEDTATLRRLARGDAPTLTAFAEWIGTV
ncbi:helix-turn-helix transcriptional regulator [Streptomyces sp. NPDC093085]|uniref:helix-turn-helix transcriptional regulator n=1 Tax=Streptomyces sp. NPDC093085 TaxID=3155068 RepID=UPI00341F9C0E